MDVPELVREELGNEAVEAGVNLGDEDVVCLTPTRTLLYRAEGLLSDEKIETFGHDVEQLKVKEGRRKTKFVLEYVEGTRSFAVPSSRESQVLELLFEGILREAGVVDPDERVQGAFRFSELALVVTDARVVKHIGAVVWSADYEVYPFADLTGLSFERGSVATEVVLEMDGRPQRIKTPNEQARKVQQVIESAAFEYHGVDSLSALNAALAPEEDGNAGDTARNASKDIGLGAGIDPLVSGDEDADSGASSSADTTSDPGDRDRPDRIDTGGEQGQASATGSHSDGTDDTGTTQGEGDGRRRSAAGDQSGGQAGSRRQAASSGHAGGEGVDAAAVEQRLSELTTAVQQQNELLEKQHRTIKQLIEELRQGRG